MDLPCISIIIVNYHGLRDTVACLESLEKCTYPSFEVLVYDNGSSQEESSTLAAIALPHYRYFDNKQNIGFGAANNRGIHQVLTEEKSKYIYFLNNDTVVDPSFLYEAVRKAEEDTTIGIVASLSLQYHHPEFVENAGHNFLDCGDVVPRGRGKHKSKFSTPCEVMGACSANALYRVDTLRQCGGYDESFFLNYEDADLSLRCILYGWKCIFVPSSIIYHKVNSSIQKVRDYAFNLRSQQNALKTYYYNTPLLVLLLNLPFVFIRDLFVVVMNILFFRWGIVKVFLHAKILVYKNWKDVAQKRKKRMKQKKISSWYIWTKQKNFVPVYFSYFKDIILRGHQSILESRALFGVKDTSYNKHRIKKE